LLQAHLAERRSRMKTSSSQTRPTCD
jgi:hypothetical protein